METPTSLSVFTELPFKQTSDKLLALAESQCSVKFITVPLHKNAVLVWFSAQKVFKSS